MYDGRLIEPLVINEPSIKPTLAFHCKRISRQELCYHPWYSSCTGIENTRSRMVQCNVENAPLIKMTDYMRVSVHGDVVGQSPTVLRTDIFTYFLLDNIQANAYTFSFMPSFARWKAPTLLYLWDLWPIVSYSVFPIAPRLLKGCCCIVSRYQRCIIMLVPFSRLSSVNRGLELIWCFGCWIHSRWIAMYLWSSDTFSCPNDV